MSSAAKPERRWFTRTRTEHHPGRYMSFGKVWWPWRTRTRRDELRVDFDPPQLLERRRRFGWWSERRVPLRLEDTGVTVNTVHPGDIATDITRESFWAQWGTRLFSPFLKTPAYGGQNIIHVATAPELAPRRRRGRSWPPRAIFPSSNAAPKPDAPTRSAST